MARIIFDDYCEIKRVGDGYDEYDNPIQEVIYSGECHYQERSRASFSQVITLSPLLFIPREGVLAEINDFVEITTRTGRKRKALVDVARDIDMPLSNLPSMTRLELKQVTPLLN